ncbi:putative F-box protein PP2-B8 [Cardamine amara subsp. amara]|uniref:F-box protein PP2-B8 n=1 Tax=Cardamine amara subsp. amara TaxID=228776 RepID=A0ABD1BVG0_CARAN
MTKTKGVNETRALFAIKDYFRKCIQRLKKTLKVKLLASDQSHGVDAEPVSLDDLPEECISIIISFTSPRDAFALASVSKTFESAVQSDTVWDKFIPPEYESLVISRSQDFSSKKDLYFALCHKSVLIDDGKKSLWVEKANGKRCIMLSAMHLSITWGDCPQSWEWISIPESRFETVAELVEVRLFEIRGRIKSCILSSRTRYAAYIVFKKGDMCYGLKEVAIEVVVGVVGKNLEESCRRYVCFDEAMDEPFLRRKNLVKPVWREDGWMEIKIGELFNEGGLMNNDEIEMVALENKQRNWKRGLIIQGIEIRPARL